jgi:hypothetical protein
MAGCIDSKVFNQSAFHLDVYSSFIMVPFISILLFAACIHLGYADECSETRMKVVRSGDSKYNESRASRKSSSFSLILSLNIQLFPSYIQVTYASTTNLLLSLTQGRKTKFRKLS